MPKPDLMYHSKITGLIVVNSIIFNSMLQYQNNVVNLCNFHSFSKHFKWKLTNPTYIIYLGVFLQFLVSNKQLLLSKRLVNCCTKVLKNSNFLVNMNLCCVLCILCLARFLKNKFFGCFIAIINRFLLVWSEEIFWTFVCEFKMFLASGLQSSYLHPLWPLQRLFASHIEQRARLFLGSLLNTPHICWCTWGLPQSQWNLVGWNVLTHNIINFGFIKRVDKGLITTGKV